MAARVPWVGLGVGAAVGGIVRAGLTALHIPGALGELLGIGLYAGLVGALSGGLGGATGRVLWGAVVGAGSSLLFFLMSLPFTAILPSLVGGTPPPWWELLILGAVPGGVGGWMEQLARKRRRRADVIGGDPPA